MNVLKKRGDPNPDRARKQQSLGVVSTSDARMRDLMGGYTKLTPDIALKELEDKQKQDEMNSIANNSRNPFNDPAMSAA